MGMRSGDGSSRYARGGPSLGQTVRLNHISKMVLSIVKFGGRAAVEQQGDGPYGVYPVIPLTSGIVTDHPS